MIPPLWPNDIARFHARQVQGPDCWRWLGEVNNKGYGLLALYRDNGRQRLLAHRVAYYLATGEDPGGQVVRHRCDNPSCTRSDHLQIGTQADNMRDARERGRADLSGLAKPRERRAAQLRSRLAAGVKTCLSCGETKSVDGFHRNRSTADGRQGLCKSCKNAMEREHRAATPKRPLVPCGTETAYRRHLKAGETPCEPCRYANRVAARGRQARARQDRVKRQDAS